MRRSVFSGGGIRLGGEGQADAAQGFPRFDDFRESDFAMVAPLFAKHGARATFNCIARNGTLDGETLARLEKDGNEVGDHTWRHWNHLFADPLANGQDPAHPDGGPNR